jgi:tetratricopeptide (TPR) repeat protein
MRFCPQCGSKLFPAARFCAACGEKLAPPEAAALGDPGINHPTDHTARPAGAFALGPFIAVFGALLGFGALMAYLILRQLPARENLLASAPPPPTSVSADAPSSDDEKFPPGHPQVQLPKEALAFIATIANKAHAHPDDLAAWNELGEVTLRAATFDPSYYAAATEAYAHVLKIDPENLTALRGVGNIDFDQRKPDAAIAAYEHYLSKKPDDPDVRTDLGTMLLASGAADQAIAQFKRVIEAHPEFFEARFNLGVAYGESNPVGAREALTQALKIAPDVQARSRVNQLLASLDSTKSVAPRDSVTGSAAAIAPVSAPPPANFRAAIERVMRDLPVAGDKVQSVQWLADSQARVMMDNFPMEQMPPFAATKFIADLKSGVDQAKTTFKIAAPVRIDLCDAATGRVMRSVTE